MAIHYIRQKDINYILWDRCINNSLNGSIYSSSWYLGIVAENWDALVEDDYRSVMPLVYSKKAFYQKIYKPVLTKQLGIFSVKPLSANKIEQFIKLIPKSFRSIDISFNKHNFQSIQFKKRCKELVTFEMDLIIPYEKKKKSYSANVLANIEAASKRKLYTNKGLSVSELETFINIFEEKKTVLMILKPLKQIISQLVNMGKVEIIGVYDSRNMLVSISCFIRSNQNVILLYALTNTQGAKENANYIILDSFLKSYSARNITLYLDHFDENWGAQLYRDFGAQESTYLRWTENKVPFFLRWI